MSIEEELQKILQEIKEIKTILIKPQQQIVPSEPVGKRFLTIKEWAKNHSYPSEAGMRSLIFNEEQYRCTFVKRVGRRVLVDEKEFFNWLETNPKFKTGVHHEEEKQYNKSANKKWR